jgi:UDP-N-acetylenolpyruvoylglucosamine reductase
MPGGKLSPGTHRVAAGQLLDECGCRGLRVGDAMVFHKHANIIVNAGRATAREVLELAATMKERVREKFGTELEEEVMFLGEKPKLGRQETLGAGEARPGRSSRPRRAAS